MTWRTTLGCAAMSVLLAAPVAAHHGRQHAPYDVPVAELEAAAQCQSGGATGGFDVLTGAGTSEPVLLLHGAGVTREENWSWNWWPWLATSGFEACWLQMPDYGYPDMQTTAEYVAHAVRRMSDRAGEKVDVVGHSQGGLIPRWSIKYFTAGTQVDDYVGFAVPNHGALIFDVETEPGEDFAAAFQMTTFSEFLRALNADDETPGRTSYTSIYTVADEMVQPVGTQELDGAANFALQDVCPGRVAEHLTLPADGVAFLLAVDALLHDGPADVARSGVTCTELLMPGTSVPPGLENRQTEDPAHGEPPLRPYTAERGHPRD